MASNYPAGLDHFTPLTGDEFCDTGIPDDTDLASRLNRMTAAIEAVQTELGVNPSGPDATVAATLTRDATTVTIITAALDTGQGWSGAAPVPAGWRALRIATDRAARFRGYATGAQRDADMARPRGRDPVGDHGLLLDFATTATQLSWTLTPAVDGWAPAGSLPVSVTNLGPSGPVTVHLTIVRTM